MVLWRLVMWSSVVPLVLIRVSHNLAKRQLGNYRDHSRTSLTAHFTFVLIAVVSTSVYSTAQNSRRSAQFVVTGECSVWTGVRYVHNNHDTLQGQWHRLEGNLQFSHISSSSSLPSRQSDTALQKAYCGIH